MPISGKWKNETSQKFVSDAEKTKRLAIVLIQEVDRIIDQLEFRKDMLYELWTKHRLRKPFLHTMRSKFFEVPLTELTSFHYDTLAVMNNFYNHLDEMTFYMEYTEDMPNTLLTEFTNSYRQLIALSRPLVKQLQREAKGQ